MGGLYEESVARLEAALQAACADFRAPLYAAVLEGYVHLGNVAGLGDEARPDPSWGPSVTQQACAAAALPLRHDSSVRGGRNAKGGWPWAQGCRAFRDVPCGGQVMAAFAAAVNGAALKVTRSALLARAGAGAELRTSQLLQELVRQLPSDHFRTCLAQARHAQLLQRPGNAACL